MKRAILLLLLVSCTTSLEFEGYSTGLPQDGQWKTPLALGDVNNDDLLDAEFGIADSRESTKWDESDE